jgi:hypothetical protein
MTTFIPCKNCGKHVIGADSMGKRYCSRECTLTYSTCVNCGAYFLKGNGFDAEHCSKDCTVKYVIMRKYGPEPVSIVAEV